MKPFVGSVAFSRFCDVIRDRCGTAAVEFAGILPLMLVVYIGSVEVGDGYAIDRKVSITARTVTDLATQYVAIYNADMTNILGASSAIIAPYPVANLVVTLSEVTIDSQGKATITWSDSFQGTARTVGQSVTLPTAIDTPNTSLIWGEVQYNYTPNLA